LDFLSRTHLPCCWQLIRKIGKKRKKEWTNRKRDNKGGKERKEWTNRKNRLEKNEMGNQKHREEKIKKMTNITAE
jgi:hypothetical protein